MQVGFAKILQDWKEFRVFNKNLLFITFLQCQTVKYRIVFLCFGKKIYIFEPTNENMTRFKKVGGKSGHFGYKHNT